MIAVDGMRWRVKVMRRRRNEPRTMKFLFLHFFSFLFFFNLKTKSKKKILGKHNRKKKKWHHSRSFSISFQRQRYDDEKKHRGRRGRIGNSVKIKKTNKKKRVLYHLVVEVGAMIDDRRDSPPSLTLNLLLLVHFCFLNFYFVFFSCGGRRWRRTLAK